MYQAVGSGRTDTGKVREGNEDAFRVIDDLGLYLVADGMGGHAAGEVASGLCVGTVEAEVRASAEWLDGLRRQGRMAREDREACLTLLENAVAQACRAIYQQSRFQAQCKGMGCTLTALLVVADRGFVAHVGDSRLYLHRGGRTNLLTQDHRVIDELLRAGRITPERARELNLDNALSRAVGVQPVVQTDVLDMEVMDHDRFLLCSDGLHGLLDTQEVRERLAGHGREDLPGLFITEVNARGGPDNVTCIVLDIGRFEARTATPALIGPGATAESILEFEAPLLDSGLLEPRLASGAEETLSAERTAQRFNFTMLALERVPMFRHLTYKERVSFLAAADDRTYAPGDVLMAEGSPGDEFFVLVDGECAIRKSGVEIAIVGGGSPLGDMALVSRKPRTATVVAVSEARAIVVGREAFFQFLRGDTVAATKLLWACVQVLTDRLASTTSDLELARTATARTAVEMPIYKLSEPH